VPVEAPPHSPDQEELDALIEEARRRARRRRLGYAAAAVTALAVAGGLFLLIGGGNSGGGGSPRVHGRGNPSGGARSATGRSSSASRATLYLRRCPGRGLQALPLTRNAKAATRSIVARRVGTSPKIDVAIRPGTAGTVEHLCGPKIAHRTLWVLTYDHRFDHGPNKSASLAQHRFAVSRFDDGYHLWYLEH
jgi:hypothetical protein